MLASRLLNAFVLRRTPAVASSAYSSVAPSSPSASAPSSRKGARKGSDASSPLNDLTKELTFGSGPKISPILPATVRTDALRNLKHEVVDVNRVGYVTEGGKVIRFSALVVVGNKKGVIGFGHGKSLEQSVAVNKAISDAHKNLLVVPREANGTLPCEAVAHFAQCKVVIRRNLSSFGVTGAKPLAALCRLGGINNVSIKTYGSRNYLNTIRAFFKALGSMLTPEEVAQARGLPMYNANQYELRLRQAK
eukprot:TRINITY_DN10978_c0_g1_i1.p1 TRINITY_DN10978_c0_g1~~TRINITY_DN10978_c0_g1_i1.p1  ORF type:complete len:249 (+),score=61.14 TRINITY_DN10978_c0_g1_i1:49-795(+)